MNSSRFWSTGNVKLLVVGLVVVLAMAFLLLQSTQATMVYYITVSELKAQGSTESGAVRLVGHVIEDPVRVEGTDAQKRFTIEEGGQTLVVTTDVMLPDTLKQGVSAVVEGKLSADGTFKASQVMAQCPSKYESELK